MSERGTSDDGLAPLEAELADVARRMESRTDPGSTASGVVVGMLMLLASLTLPWTGEIAGWEVLTGAAALGVLPPLFAYTAIGFGVVGSALALTTRWWGLAWTCAVGCGFSVLDGVWAIWSRQVAVPDGGTAAGFGLVLGVLGVVVLTFCWVRIALRR
ncbi:MAG: Rv2732c family membrane protein [Pseudonocardia sp.]